MMFDMIWFDISKNSILTYENMNILYDQIMLCDKIGITATSTSTAEVGVYEGMTSKLIRKVLKKPHYCYDTFEGIVGSTSLYGDSHHKGEFMCELDRVKQNINMDKVFYKKGWFPETFEETTHTFSFVYSDTATYFGAKHTFECFKSIVVSGGKIIFYADKNCLGVINAIQEFSSDELFVISHINNFIIFTKK